jgi:hypothetical protein
MKKMLDVDELAVAVADWISKRYALTLVLALLVYSVSSFRVIPVELPEMMTAQHLKLMRQPTTN